jgi:exodeoxyribonuclease III
MSADMKVATWNVNGIRAREAQLCDWLARDQPDVVCLQELKAKPEQIPESCKLPDYHVYWHGVGAYSGVSLHIRKDHFDGQPQFTHPEFDMETRIVQVEFGNLVLASVYVPNGGKDYAAKMDFLRRLATWTRQVHDEGRELILCGDMNIAHSDMDVHPKERKPGVIGQRPEERAVFDALLGGNLVDVCRALQPDNASVFSWWPPWRNMRQRNIGWRIDYILASRSIADRARSCVVLADVGTSDHAPVVMTTD